MRILLVPLFAFLSATATTAQNPPEAWLPLTDSVFQVLHLSEDQIERCRVIDADYNEKRHKLQVDARTMTATDHDRLLSGVIAAREKEIQGVMTHDQFQQWIGRPKRPETRRLKGTPRR